jgi:hypothetical protein
MDLVEVPFQSRTLPLLSLSYLQLKSMGFKPHQLYYLRRLKMKMTNRKKSQTKFPQKISAKRIKFSWPSKDARGVL